MRLFRRAKTAPTFEDLSRAIEADPSAPGPYVARAEWRYEHGFYQEAEADYSRALALDPDCSVDAYLGRGSCYWRLAGGSDGEGLYLRALDDYSQVVARDPGHHDGYVSLGLTYEALGRYDEALVNYNQGVELAPYNADPHYNRALFFEQLGRHDQALADFDRTIEILSAAGDEPDYLRGVQRRRELLIASHGRSGGGGERP